METEDIQIRRNSSSNSLKKPLQWDLTEHFKQRGDIIPIKHKLNNQYVKVRYLTCSVSDYVHQQEAKHLKRLEKLQKIEKTLQLYKINKALQSIHPGGEQFYITLDGNKIIAKTPQYWNFYLKTLNTQQLNQNMINKNNKQLYRKKLHSQIKQLHAQMRMCNIRIKSYYNKLSQLSSLKYSSSSRTKFAKSQVLRSINYERKYILKQQQLLLSQLKISELAASMNKSPQINAEHKESV